jgi:hypothetical protein
VVQKHSHQRYVSHFYKQRLTLRILDVMGPFYQEWVDAGPCPQRINSRTWHHRRRRSRCLVCKKHYLPALHRQRYCATCRRWVHVECLGEHSGVDFDAVGIVPEINLRKLDEDAFPAVWEGVLALPTVRGHHDRYDFDNTWLITGSGTHKALIEEWKANGEYPPKWSAVFGEGFLQDVLRKKFRWYECPGCKNHI